MADVIVYSKATCPYCDWAKALLKKHNIVYTEIRIDLDPEKAQAMIALTGRRTVPQIIIKGQPIGGFDDLSVLERSGELARLLAS
jgi:glutaredoxin 3